MKNAKTRESVTAEELQQKFIYEPETGKIYRKLGDDDWSAKGKECFTSPQDGYLQGTCFGFTFGAHRVAWAITHGE